MQFEFLSSEELVTNDEDDDDDDVDSQVWSETESESDAESLEDYGIMEEVPTNLQGSTMNPFDCY